MTIEEFGDRHSAAAAAADMLQAALRRRLAANGAATLVASGGTSPAECLRMLSEYPLDWANVTVTLSDERWVGNDDADSNERMLRSTLFANEAAEARLLPFYDGSVDIESRCRQLDDEIRNAPFPFACALLGMGEDGHFASLFPDAPQLRQGLDLESDRLCLPIDTAASPHRRISLSLAALSRSDVLLLLAFGDRKRRVLDEAIEVRDRHPLSRLVRQKRAPLHVLWAP
jgi:6-phosphogluconolactonase